MMKLLRKSPVSITPGEALVLELAQELIDNPPFIVDIDYDNDGNRWVKIPALAISELLLSRFMVSYSAKRTRTVLSGLVAKGFLLRTQHIGEHKWVASYFYRLQPSA